MVKAKSKAFPRVPQSREEAVRAIGEIGTLRREIAARKAAADESVRAIGEAVEQAMEPLLTTLDEIERGLQTWCEANRGKLTSDGRVKYHDFGTGRVLWRLRPPKVTIKGIETVIEACKSLGLARFVRVKEEVNRDAMLADPSAARAIAGVSIGPEGEDFVIEPTELAEPRAAA